jgi:hypothetical protein
VRSAWILLSLLAVGCRPPQFDYGTTSGTESTTIDGTDSSTSNASESSTTETEESSTDTSDTSEDLPIVECNPYTQDCPAGEKCVPYADVTWEGHKCVPVLGDQAPGESCTYAGGVEATDDCDGTSHCWDGICRSFCTGTEGRPECPPGADCYHHFFNVCIPTCDPILQDCEAGFVCHWTNGPFLCLLEVGDTPLGQPCSFIDCAAGLACLIAEVVPGCEALGEQGCCSSYCDLNLGDGPCEALLPGTVCASFFEEGMAPAGYEHVGVCVLPP